MNKFNFLYGKMSYDENFLYWKSFRIRLDCIESVWWTKPFVRREYFYVGPIDKFFAKYITKTYVRHWGKRYRRPEYNGFWKPSSFYSPLIKIKMISGEDYSFCCTSIKSAVEIRDGISELIVKAKGKQNED